MEYLMITNWDNTFLKRGEYETYYTTNFIKDEINENSVNHNSFCIFVNIKHKKSFSGLILKITRKDGNKVYFRIRLENEIKYDQNYDFKHSGWYKLPAFGKNIIDEVAETISAKDYNNKYSPSFFTELIETTDFRKFENLCYYLLKCIGINNIVKIDPNRAQGRPDGFFIMNNFAVIYDAKLNQAFRSDPQQILNYCSQLQSGKYEYMNQTFSLSSATKAVWIITRRRTELIKVQDGITVMEVHVISLFNIYYERLDRNLSEIELVQRLINI